MIDAIADAFPKRPVKLICSTGSPAGMAVLLIVCLGGGIAAFLLPWFSLLPDLKRDWEIAADAESFDPSEQFVAPFRSGSVVQGECGTYGYLLKDCKIKVSYRDAKGAARTRQISLMFVDFSSGNYKVGAVRSASNPDLVSVDLAVERLWSRCFTMLGMMLFGMFMIVAGPYAAFKNRAVRAAVQNLSGLKLTPVAVKVLSQGIAYGVNTVSYLGGTGPEAKKCNVSLGRQKPFMLHSGGNEALGLTATGHEYVFLVDEALTRLDISDNERQCIRRARGNGGRDL